MTRSAVRRTPDTWHRPCWTSRRRRPLGIVHVAGGGLCSWYEFARAIVAESGLPCEVKPCTTAEMPRPATRPAYSVLRSERGDEAPALSDWHEGLAEYTRSRGG